MVLWFVAVAFGTIWGIGFASADILVDFGTDVLVNFSNFLLDNKTPDCIINCNI